MQMAEWQGDAAPCLKLPLQRGELRSPRHVRTVVPLAERTTADFHSSGPGHPTAPPEPGGQPAPIAGVHIALRLERSPSDMCLSV